MAEIQPKSFHLQWSITERCNLDCKHCYKDKDLIKSELDSKDLLVILDKFVNQVEKWNLNKRDTRISFTGGEPFVKEGFFDLLKKAKENHDKFSYGILTNGTSIDKEMINKLQDLEVDYMQISLEGMKEKNDYIRGEGMFEKIIEAAKKIKKAGIEINFSMTVSKMNLEDVPKVIQLSKDLKIPVAIRRLVPLGNGKELRKYLLEPKEVKQLWHYILEVKRKAWGGISIGCEDSMLTQDFPQYQPGECSAGYASFTVLPNGDVYPCRRLPIYSGNLTKQNFEKIYNSKEMERLRNINNTNNVCYECPHFENCKGGAKCLSFAYFNDAQAPDPQCWRLFKDLPKSSLKWENSKEERKERLDKKWYKEK